MATEAQCQCLQWCLVARQTGGRAMQTRLLDIDSLTWSWQPPNSPWTIQPTLPCFMVARGHSHQAKMCSNWSNLELEPLFMTDIPTFKAGAI